MVFMRPAIFADILLINNLSIDANDRFAFLGESTTVFYSLGERCVGHVVLDELGQTVGKDIPKKPEHPQRNHDGGPQLSFGAGQAVEQCRLPFMKAPKRRLPAGHGRWEGRRFRQSLRAIGHEVLQVCPERFG